MNSLKLKLLSTPWTMLSSLDSGLGNQLPCHVALFFTIINDWCWTSLEEKVNWDRGEIKSDPFRNDCVQRLVSKKNLQVFGVILDLFAKTKLSLFWHFFFGFFSKIHRTFIQIFFSFVKLPKVFDSFGDPLTSIVKTNTYLTDFQFGQEKFYRKITNSQSFTISNSAFSTLSFNTNSLKKSFLWVFTYFH